MTVPNTENSSRPVSVPRRIAVLAGEPSGDLLAAPLIEELRKLFPDALFRGVVGPRMLAAGCQKMEHIDALSLFGISEVIRELPRLYRLRESLFQRILEWQPDVFIGIDAPSFNLGLEKRLKQAGIPVVHYVSPTVWAWREGRVRTIRESVDLMLALFPFEADFYRDHQVDVRYVGHPLADQLPLEPDRFAARRLLDMENERPYVAVLPGSRSSEVEKLASPFLDTMLWLQKRLPEVGFIVPLANAKARSRVEEGLISRPEIHNLKLLDGKSHEAMTAADVVLLASGTAALEACLFKRPTVAAYRVSPATRFLLEGVGLLKVAHVTLPNNLTTPPIVPEFLHEQATPENLGTPLYRWLTRPWTQSPVIEACRSIHEKLRLGASCEAARAISELMDSRS